MTLVQGSGPLRHLHDLYRVGSSRARWSTPRGPCQRQRTTASATLGRSRRRGNDDIILGTPDHPIVENSGPDAVTRVRRGDPRHAAIRPPRHAAIRPPRHAAIRPPRHAAIRPPRRRGWRPRAPPPPPAKRIRTEARRGPAPYAAVRLGGRSQRTRRTMAGLDRVFTSISFAGSDRPRCRDRPAIPRRRATACSATAGAPCPKAPTTSARGRTSARRR